MALKRTQCQYKGTYTSGKQCPSPALPGKVMCAKHGSAGGGTGRKMIARIKKLAAERRKRRGE